MKLFVIANWKMNPLTKKEAKRLFASLKKGVRGRKNIEIVICPPFVYLPFISSFIVHRSLFKLGAQNCFWKDKGPYTGEVSPQMLKSMGCRYVIVGHSERRQVFKETDEMVNVKIKEILKAKLQAIFCIGETEEEKRTGKLSKFWKEKLKKD